MIDVVIDNSYTRLVGCLHPDAAIRSNIHEALRQDLGYFDPNAKHSPKYKLGEWDGMRTLYKRKDQKFPAGLTRYALEVLKEYEVPFRVIDSRVRPTPNFEVETRFIEMGRPLRFYQEVGAERAVSVSRGILALFTGSGKTVTCCEIIARAKVKPVIFVVPTRSLMYQTKREFEKYLKVEGTKPDIGMVGDSIYRISDGITVCVYHSLLAAYNEHYDRKSDKLINQEEEAENGKRKIKANAELLAEFKSSVAMEAAMISEYGEFDETSKRKKINPKVKKARTDRQKAESAYNTRLQLDAQKKRVRALVESCQLMIIDEAHIAAVVIQSISEKARNAYYKIGNSVGADSFVELAGGEFGRGWVGSIQDAWDRSVASGNTPLFVNGDEYIILDNVVSRGWDKKSFSWQKAKSLIRHASPLPTKEVTVAGDVLSLTNDHSVFACEPDPQSSNCLLSQKTAGELTTDSMLVADDGGSWEGASLEGDVDWLGIIKRQLANPRKVRFCVDLTNISSRQLHMSAKALWQIKSRGRLGDSLNSYQYEESRAILPRPTWLYCESANGVGLNPLIKLSKWAYMLGFWIGDGWIDGNKVNFAVKKSILPIFLDHIGNIPGLNWHPNVRDMGSGSVEVQCCSALVAALLRDIFRGAKCHNKFIPGEWIVSWPEDARRALLEGLLDSDGCKRKKQHSYCTTSLPLARCLMSLLRSLSVIGGITTVPPSLGGLIKGRRIIGKRISYVVQWSVSAQNGLHKGRHGNRSRYKHGNMSFKEAPVRAISPVNGSDFVYDVSMENHPSFCANGVLCHNSATPFREDNQEIRIEAALGKKLLEISPSEGIELGYLVPPIIFMVKIRHIEYADGWRDVLQKHVVDCWERNYRIKQFAEGFKAAGWPVIIIVDDLNHGNTLEAMIEDSVFVCGKDDGADHQFDDDDNEDLDLDFRKRILDDVERNKTILIATSWANQGVDAPKARVLILAGSGRSVSTLEQRVGRVLRCDGKDYVDSCLNGKDCAVVIDFYDEHPDLRDHSVTRKKAYKRHPKWTFQMVA